MDCLQQCISILIFRVGKVRALYTFQGVTQEGEVCPKEMYWSTNLYRMVYLYDDSAGDIAQKNKSDPNVRMIDLCMLKCYS